MITINNIKSSKNELLEDTWGFDLYIDGELFREFSLPQPGFTTNNNPDEVAILKYLTKIENHLRKSFNYKKTIEFKKTNNLSNIDGVIKYLSEKQR